MAAHPSPTLKNSAARKTVGIIIIIGFAILLGTLAIVIFWPAPADKEESQALLELKHSLAALDDLETRGILSPEIAEAERQRYLDKTQINFSQPHIQALIEIKYRLATLDDLQSRGFLSAEVAEEERQRYLTEAQEIVGGTLETSQLPTLLKHLDSRQIVETQSIQPSNDLAIPSIIWVLLGILLVAAVGWLVQPYLAAIRQGSHTRYSSDYTPAAGSSEREKTKPTLKENRRSDRTIPPHLFPAQHRKNLSNSITFTPEQFDLSPLSIELLTERELEVLQLVAAGLSNREIAQKLTITPGTAKVHISNIYSKLSVNRRVQAVARAQELGILSSEQD